MSGPAFVDNAVWATAPNPVSGPVISVLMPFLHDDPIALLGMLETEAPALGGRVEVVLLDDGTGDPDLTARLTARIMALALPCRLITLTANAGRSKGRNRLSAAARARHLLFLDSDMRPDSPDFLQQWVALAASHDPAVAFGGFSLLQASTERRFAVHRAMAARSDCVPHHERAKTPEKYVFTSNLLVRRDVFAGEAFDAEFTGWGWEDVEWAMRVSRTHAVIHLDNPATHMGLDTADQLAAKYEQSAPNFALVVARHPDIVGSYPSFRAARLLKRLPGLGLIRSGFRRAAVAGWLPTPARALSLRLYRAALYAGVV